MCCTRFTTPRPVAENGTMKNITLILAILALGACGDDDVMTDAGPSMTDAGPTTDTGPATDTGASTDTGPSTADAGPVGRSARYRSLEVADLTLVCECFIMDGSFADQEACFAENGGNLSTEAELTCAQGVLDAASEADLAIYDCHFDAYDTLNGCLGALTCADRNAAPSSAGETACLEADDAAFEACGEATNQDDFDNCFD